MIKLKTWPLQPLVWTFVLMLPLCGAALLYLLEEDQVRSRVLQEGPTKPGRIALSFDGKTATVTGDLSHTHRVPRDADRNGSITFSISSPSQLGLYRHFVSMQRTDVVTADSTQFVIETASLQTPVTNKTLVPLDSIQLDINMMSVVDESHDGGYGTTTLDTDGMRHVDVHLRCVRGWRFEVAEILANGQLHLVIVRPLWFKLLILAFVIFIFAPGALAWMHPTSHGISLELVATVVYAGTVRTFLVGPATGMDFLVLDFLIALAVAFAVLSAVWRGRSKDSQHVDQPAPIAGTTPHKRSFRRIR